MLPKPFDFSVWRDRLLVVLIFLLPWQTRYIRRTGLLDGAPWEQGTIGLFALEVVILAALCCHLLSRSMGGDAPKKTPPVHFRLWGLFILYAIFSIFWARDMDAVLFSWFHLFEGFALAYLIWVSRLPLKTLLTVFIGGEALAAGLGLWQFAAQQTFGASWLGLAAHPAAQAGASVLETTSGRYLRAYGPFPHPNVFGGYMAAALSAAVALAAEGTEHPKARKALHAAVTIFLAALGVSFSRSAAAAYGLLLVSVALMTSLTRAASEERRRWRDILILHVVMAGLFTLAFAPLIGPRLAASGRLEENSLAERALSVSQGFALFSMYPAFGVGLGNMVPAAYDDLRPFRPAYLYQPAHFLPALAGAELGFFGLMILLGAAGFWLVEAWPAARAADHPVTRVAALMPIMLLVIGLFDHYLLTQFAGTMLAGALFGFFLKAGDS